METDVISEACPAGWSCRGAANGEYRRYSRREFASLEDIEGISGTDPRSRGVPPARRVRLHRDIQYSAATRSCTVVLQVAEQVPGDVAGYQSQVSELEEDLARKDRELEETAATLAEKEADIARQAGDHRPAGGGPGRAGGGRNGGPGGRPAEGGIHGGSGTEWLRSERLR